MLYYSCKIDDDINGFIAFSFQNNTINNKFKSHIFNFKKLISIIPSIKFNKIELDKIEKQINTKIDYYKKAYYMIKQYFKTESNKNILLTTKNKLILNSDSHNKFNILGLLLMILRDEFNNIKINSFYINIMQSLTGNTNIYQSNSSTQKWLHIINLAINKLDKIIKKSHIKSLYYYSYKIINNLNGFISFSITNTIINNIFNFNLFELDRININEKILYISYEDIKDLHNEIYTNINYYKKIYFLLKKHFQNEYYKDLLLKTKHIFLYNYDSIDKFNILGLLIMILRDKLANKSINNFYKEIMLSLIENNSLYIKNKTTIYWLNLINKIDTKLQNYINKIHQLKLEIKSEEPIKEEPINEEPIKELIKEELIKEEPIKESTESYNISESIQFDNIILLDLLDFFLYKMEIFDWNMMKKFLIYQFTIDKSYFNKLKDTKDKFILEHTNTFGKDIIWSNNKNGLGKNWLGLQLMLIREKSIPNKTFTNLIDDTNENTIYKSSYIWPWKNFESAINWYNLVYNASRQFINTKYLNLFSPDSNLLPDLYLLNNIPKEYLMSNPFLNYIKVDNIDGDNSFKYDKYTGIIRDKTNNEILGIFINPYLSTKIFTNRDFNSNKFMLNKIIIIKDKILDYIRSSTSADNVIQIESLFNCTEYSSALSIDIVSDINEYKHIYSLSQYSQLGINNKIGQFIIKNAANSRINDGINMIDDFIYFTNKDLKAYSDTHFNIIEGNLELINGYLKLPYIGDFNFMKNYTNIKNILYKNLHMIRIGTVLNPSLKNGFNNFNDIMNNNYSDTNHRLAALVYSSTIPLNGFVNPDNPSEFSILFAEIMLIAQYYNVIQLAYFLSKKLNKCITTILTPIGDILFNNNSKLITYALDKSLNLFITKYNINALDNLDIKFLISNNDIINEYKNQFNKLYNKLYQNL